MSHTLEIVPFGTISFPGKYLVTPRHEAPGKPCRGIQGEMLSISVKDTLADKGIHPSDEHLKKIEAKWAEIRQLKGDLENANLDDADIALRNIPGGDHVG